MKLTKVLSILMVAMLSLAGMDFDDDKLISDPRPQLPKAERTKSEKKAPSLSKSEELIYLIDEGEAHWNGEQWEEEFRKLYSYDDSSRQTMEIRQFLEESGWRDLSKLFYFYGGSDLPTLEEEWDNYDGVWEAVYQIQYEYNAQGQITEELMRHWSGEAWTNYSRRLYVFNDSDQLLEFRQDHWDGTDWRYWRREVLTYNDQNQHISTNQMSWHDSGWVDVRQYLYSYNDYGNITEFVQQVWDDSLWTNIQQALYTYDGAQNLIEYLEQQWTDSVWTNLYFSIFEYTALSMTVTEQDWQEESWQNSARLFIEYDTHGREVVFQVEIWDFDAQDWTYYFKDESIYDRWGNQIEYFHSEWDGSEWQYSGKMSWNWSPLYTWLQKLSFSDGLLETELSFGMHAFASDSYDDILDQYAPPAPPAGELDARFTTLGEDYMRDIRSSSATSPITWELSFDGDEATGLIFSWDSSAFPPNGTFTLQKSDGTSILEMKNFGSYSHNSGEPKTLQIVYTFEPVSILENVATRFTLHPNFPNPFNPQTTISWELPEAGPVQLTIFNIQGQKVATLVNQELTAGFHSVEFSPQTLGLATGVYLCRLQNKSNTEVRKMLYIK